MGERKGWRGGETRSEAHYLELTLSMGVQTTTLAPVALHGPSKSQGRRGRGRKGEERRERCECTTVSVKLCEQARKGGWEDTNPWQTSPVARSQEEENRRRRKMC